LKEGEKFSIDRDGKKSQKKKKKKKGGSDFPDC
jgi:hypothetical protein